MMKKTPEAVGKRLLKKVEIQEPITEAAGSRDQKLLDSIAAARKHLAKRQRAVLDLANTAADTPIGDPRGDHARKILAEVGARVQLEEAAGVPLQFRTDPERAIAEELERGTAAKFITGRKVGSVGAVQKKVTALLKARPTMSAIELWRAIQSAPPRGWVFYDEPEKYAMGPGGANLAFSTFRNKVTKGRNSLKG